MRQPSSTSKNTLIVILLACMLTAGVIVSFYFGRYPIRAGELGGIILSKVVSVWTDSLRPVISSLFNVELKPVVYHQFWTDTMETVLFNVRLPRILLACMVGCCLSAAGASYQGIFQNPMAAPDILGASSGAAFGAALAILNGASGLMVTASAFLFSLLTVALVLLVSRKAKGSKILGLILSGIMVSSLFTAGTSYIKLVADPNDQLPQITYWLIGSLAGAKKQDVLFAAIPMTLGLIPLLLLRWRINILTFGDDEARTIGVNATAVRFIVIICATLITATSVAVSGMIGWVGLVVPHLARRLVGNNYKHLMPATMLFGALFLLLVDNISRNVLTTEIPIGILTAFIGAPFFMYLITREAGSK